MNTIPPPLAAGDAVGIAAPASPFDRAAFESGCRMVESLGFKPVFSKDVFASHSFFAGKDELRARRLNEFFADPGIRGIWTVRGGYGFLRILSLLDYSLIRANPKVIIGCSDISAGLNTIFRKCGISTVHGPMVTSLASADKATLSSVMALISGGRLPVLAAGGPVIAPGKAGGPVMGGNLTTLCHMFGTPYEPDFKGAILFLEDIGEKPYRIDRMIFQMKLAGVFERIAGICLGTFVNCGNMGEIYHIFEDIFKDTGVPVLAGFQVGHCLPNLSFPIGLSALLDTDARKLTYTPAGLGG